MKRHVPHTAVLIALTAALSASVASATAPAQARIESAARSARVTDLNVSASAGAVMITGKLQNVPFVVRYPANWNGGAVYFAHGYVTPGRPEVIPTDTDPSGGLLTAAGAQGYATAYTAYSKTGYAVQSGVEATMRLKRFLDATGAKRSYITGASMGGNIAVALVEKYPNAFAGALPYCGVVGGWAEEIRYLTDVRVVYDYVTRGTPYALPGAGNALAPNPALTVDAVRASVGALFQAALRNPLGPEGQALAVVATATGTNADPVSFVTALAGNAYGLQDYLATTGGNGYDNSKVVYSSPLLDDAASRALNEGVQRFAATPAARAYLARWYTPVGKFNAKVLSVHNTIDPLVPYSHQQVYRRVVTNAGNGENLVQQIVQPKPVDLADIANSGPAHCYFTPQQLAFAWNELRAWVEEGVRPQDGRDITRP